MDSVGIFYLYEPHLQQVTDGFYLPDFYLPHVDIYLEVKGKYPTEEELRKAQDVIDRTGKHVAFLVARPESDKYGFCNCCLIVRGRYRWADVSLHDLDQIFKIKAGHDAWVVALLSVRETEMDTVRPLGEVMEEVCMGFMDRSTMETHLRMTHLRVNEARSQEPHEISLAEQGLKWWFDSRAYMRAEWAAERQEARA
jgi:hypothetical protein